MLMPGKLKCSLPATVFEGTTDPISKLENKNKINKKKDIEEITCLNHAPYK